MNKTLLASMLALGITAVSTTAMAFDFGAARQGRGADDPVGHIRGANDLFGHLRQGRGADDPVGHIRGGSGADDLFGHLRQGRGADDPIGHIRAGGNSMGGLGLLGR